MLGLGQPRRPRRPPSSPQPQWGLWSLGHPRRRELWLTLAPTPRGRDSKGTAGGLRPQAWPGAGSCRVQVSRGGQRPRVGFVPAGFLRSPGCSQQAGSVGCLQHCPLAQTGKLQLRAGQACPNQGSSGSSPQARARLRPRVPSWGPRPLTPEGPPVKSLLTPKTGDGGPGCCAQPGLWSPLAVPSHPGDRLGAGAAQATELLRPVPSREGRPSGCRLEVAQSVGSLLRTPDCVLCPGQCCAQSPGSVSPRSSWVGDRTGRCRGRMGLHPPAGLRGQGVLSLCSLWWEDGQAGLGGTRTCRQARV